MANSYSQCTVDPEIPKEFITEEEVKFLELSGFTLEKCGRYENGERIPDGNYYIYASDFFDMDGNSAYESVDDEGDKLSELYSKWSAYSIFQAIISRSEGKIPEVVVEAAYTCDKLRMGEFGGSIHRITADSIQEGGTNQLLYWFRKNPKKNIEDFGNK